MDRSLSGNGLLIQEIIDLTSQLVGIPAQTDLNSEKNIAGFIHTWLNENGLPSQIIGPEQHPSVLCVLKKGNGAVLWLESPLDTVPAGDPANWRTKSPFRTEIINGRMIGRGVADARLAIAMFSILAREVSQDHTFKGTLVLAFDADEQSGRFTGIKQIIQRAPKADGIILGYQGAGEISIGARGILRLWIHIQGKSAHPGSRSCRGVNAINQMAQVLLALSETALANHTEPHFPFGSQLQPTLIKGGDALNRVPDQCSAFIDVRLLPSMDKAQVINQIAAVIDDIHDGHYTLEEVQYYPGFLTPPDSQLVQIVQEEAQQAAGKALPLVASGPTSVGCVLADQAPVINCFGVESGNVHADNEWILPDDIPTVYQTWYRTVIRFCSE
ncbi:M20 family metallopeptidase [Endozoicomonas elysicola]|uniref:Peptidase M20 dimerisation domain-containing protein n=1 Tax=Endozoicomonas elysicola TaxID=305900 RepID=A0A081K5F2_9GAMM|nr:M20 family metallopeptidase [Endozoicomonas elysicola]KEI69378.1 hypothetical protein GV64_00270 [Endozoicomonas elysicola]